MSKKSKQKLNIIPNSKSVITTIIIVVILVAALAAGYFVQSLQRQSQQNTEQKEQFSITGGSAALPDAANDSQTLAQQGDAEAAEEEIEQALQNNPTDDAKYELYIQRGLNLANQSQTDAAFEQFRLAEAIKPQGYKAIRLIADLALRLENRPLALEYYKKALPLVDPENVRFEAEKRTIQERIDAIEQGRPIDA